MSESSNQISVDVLRMDTTRGPDFFVRIKCGDRSVTPHVFRERFKCEYEVAHYSWVFGLRPDEPDLMAYDEVSHPNTPEA